MKKDKSNSQDDLITQAEAARLRDSTIPAINELVRRGRLQSVERYGRTLVYRSEVMSFEPSKGGRPPKIKVETDSKVSKKDGKK